MSAHTHMHTHAHARTVPKHILVQQQVERKITQSGVLEGIVGHSLSIIHPLIRPKTQQLRQSQLAVPCLRSNFSLSLCSLTP